MNLNDYFNPIETGNTESEIEEQTQDVDEMAVTTKTGTKALSFVE